MHVLNRVMEMNIECYEHYADAWWLKENSTDIKVEIKTKLNVKILK